MTATQNKRNTGIDLLRGISILAVILLHLNFQVEFKQTDLGSMLSRRWYSIFFWSGFYGVAMFFVLSGYLITSSALKKWGNLSTVKTKDFYLMRFARIMPLLLLLLAVLSILHLFQVPGFGLNPDKVSLGRAIFAALTFHFNWLEIQVGYLPANWDILWSLSIEETFYLLFPLACLLARKEWHFVAIISIFLVISPWARVGLYPDNELGDRNHLAYLDGIAMGCITALIARRIDLPKYILNILMVLGGALVVFIFAFRSTVFQLGLTKNGLYISILSLGVSLIILWMHHKHQQGQQKSSVLLKWIEHMGRHSYEIYLTHMFVIIFCVKIFKNLALANEAIYLLYILVIAFSYSLGRFVATYFSDPMNRWLRRKWIY